ncbi:MAG TPA: class I SAM-dependent methyltransferase [Polyangiaceae bacterium]|nr:class I SAM-dependent methyltransferase [Polyangiaceae bacterium]
MTENIDSGYVTGVTYLRGFQSDLSPSRLRMCAALNGFTPPSQDDFDYCEVGCGFGDTTLALAAAFPNARFVGIDLNPAHVEAATADARAAELGNVRFIAKDFEVAASELPAFDYVTAHGVLSWIPSPKRKALGAFASSKLKPGGLAYFGYNALPGWAAVEPLRQLIVARAQTVPDDPTLGARRGLDLAKALRESGARYFVRNPAAADMLTTIEKAGLTYVVHEYLNAQWLPMYFAQVAAEMAAGDLFFVGQLPLHLNFRDLCIPARAQPFFAAVADRLAYEGLKDFALNTFFRQDVFVKGAPGRSDATSRAWLMSTPFGMSGDEPPWTGESQLPNHLLRFRGPIFDALVPALRDGARTIPTLLARPELKGVPEERVREALLHLLIGGAITAFVEPTEARAAPPRPRVASAYNRHVLARALASDGSVPAVLVSTALGNGVRLTQPELVALTALTGDLPAPDLGVSISTRVAKLVELGVVT